jgi:hypothetical protein
VFDTRKKLEQHHIHLRQLPGILANEPVFRMEFAMAGVLVFVLFMMLLIVVFAFSVMCIFFVFVVGIRIMAGIVFDIRFHRGF